MSKTLTRRKVLHTLPAVSASLTLPNTAAALSKNSQSPETGSGLLYLELPPVKEAVEFSLRKGKVTVWGWAEEADNWITRLTIIIRHLPRARQPKNALEMLKGSARLLRRWDIRRFNDQPFFESLTLNSKASRKLLGTREMLQVQGQFMFGVPRFPNAALLPNRSSDSITNTRLAPYSELLVCLAPGTFGQVN